MWCCSCLAGIVVSGFSGFRRTPHLLSSRGWTTYKGFYFAPCAPRRGCRTCTYMISGSLPVNLPSSFLLFSRRRRSMGPSTLLWETRKKQHINRVFFSLRTFPARSIRLGVCSAADLCSTTRNGNVSCALRGFAHVSNLFFSRWPLRFRSLIFPQQLKKFVLRNNQPDMKI